MIAQNKSMKKNIERIKINYIALLLMFISSILTGNNTEPLRVLFIGNSYTGFHNLPEIVAQIANSKNRRLYYETVAPGGRNFESHWKEGNALTKIYKNKWDMVVFQNLSFEPLIDPDNMNEFGTRFAKAVNETDAKIFYYLTWTYESELERLKDKAWFSEKYGQMQKHINNAYFNLAVEVGAEVCPIGIAWEIVRNENPQVKLYDEDGSHPSKLGAYLSGLVMFSVLFKEELTDAPQVLYPYLDPESREKWGKEISVSTEERILFESVTKRAIKISNEILKNSIQVN